MKRGRKGNLEFKSGAELGVNGGKVARVDAGGADGGEKVGIVGPSGDDVDVEMLGHAGAGGGAEVEADVESLGFHGLAEGVGHAVDEGPEVGGLLGGEGGEVVHLPVRADQIGRAHV